MIIVALLIGVVLVIAAIRGSQSTLFSALATDVPAFVVWAAAIFAVGAIGFVPGLKTPSRLLLGLVIIVLIVNNYQAILAGVQNVSSSGAGVSSSSSSSNSTSSSSSSSPVSTAQSSLSNLSASSNSTFSI
jgi:hypothetical protein